MPRFINARAHVQICEGYTRMRAHTLSLWANDIQAAIPVNMRFTRGVPMLENRISTPVLEIPCFTSDPEEAVRVRAVVSLHASRDGGGEGALCCLTFSPACVHVLNRSTQPASTRADTRIDACAQLTHAHAALPFPSRSRCVLR